MADIFSKCNVWELSKFKITRWGPFKTPDLYLNLFISINTLQKRGLKLIVGCTSAKSSRTAHCENAGLGDFFWISARKSHANRSIESPVSHPCRFSEQTTEWLVSNSILRGGSRIFQRGAKLIRGLANLPFDLFFPKTAWKLRNFGSEGGHHPCAS